MNSNELLLNELKNLLQEFHWHITTAESCTGGMIASMLVDLSGISEFFHEGYVTYSEEAKHHMIGVPMETIEKYGVVSLETAQAMAFGAAKTANAECSIATTGVAGPTGGTKETPVGCVCIACYVNHKLFSEKQIFSGTRREIREQASLEAISFLIHSIKEEIK